LNGTSSSPFIFPYVLQLFPDTAFFCPLSQLPTFRLPFFSAFLNAEVQFRIHFFFPLSFVNSFFSPPFFAKRNWLPSPTHISRLCPSKSGLHLNRPVDTVPSSARTLPVLSPIRPPSLPKNYFFLPQSPSSFRCPAILSLLPNKSPTSLALSFAHCPF